MNVGGEGQYESRLNEYTENFGNNYYVVAGGYNGGGTVSATNGYSSSGGGATHVATASGILSSLEGNKESVLIVAGGGGGGGSGYIGNSLLTDKHMAGYEVTTSDDESTKTISVENHSATPTADYAKEGNGYARISLVSYTIHFDANGGTGSMDDQIITIGQNNTLSANQFSRAVYGGPYSNNYVFTSWNTKANGSGTSYTDQQVISGALDDNATTLYAQWAHAYFFDINAALVRKDDDVLLLSSTSYNGSTIALFNVYLNGTLVKAQTTDYFALLPTENDVKVELTSITTPTGMEFANDLVENGTYSLEKINSGGLNIPFRLIPYKITYILNGGTNSEENADWYDIYTQTSIRDPSKTGYTFEGWTYDGQTTPVKYPNVSITRNSSTGDKTYTANWVPNTYTVKFDANNGTGTMNDEHFIYDTEQILTANAFTREYYTFAGWNTKADGTGAAYVDKASIKNLTDENSGTVTLYAQWKHNLADLTVSKTVSGNYGSKDRYFKFTVDLKDLGASETYSLDLSKTSASTTTNNSTNAVQTNPTTFTTDSSGNATVTVWLKHGESIVFKDLYEGCTYNITEDPENYTASNTITPEEGL